MLQKNRMFSLVNPTVAFGAAPLYRAAGEEA